MLRILLGFKPKNVKNISVVVLIKKTKCSSSCIITLKQQAHSPCCLLIVLMMASYGWMDGGREGVLQLFESSLLHVQT